MIDNLPRCAEYGFTSNPPEDSDAVVAHVESSKCRRRRPPRTLGQPSDVTVFAVSDNLVRALSIRRTIAELLSELGTILERIDASVSVDSSPAAPVSEPEVVDGKSH